MCRSRMSRLFDSTLEVANRLARVCGLCVFLPVVVENKVRAGAGFSVHCSLVIRSVAESGVLEQRKSKVAQDKGISRRCEHDH